MDEPREQREAMSLAEVLSYLDSKMERSEVKPSEAWEFRQAVIAKYGLPESDWRWDKPREYIEQIERIAKEREIKIKPKHEFGSFFQENPQALALTLGRSASQDTTMVVAPDGNDWYELRAKANHLAHEIVHALQDQSELQMPLELAEKEAFYYQMLSENFFREHMDDPDYVNYHLNEGLGLDIQKSIGIDEEINKK